MKGECLTIQHSSTLIPVCIKNDKLIDSFFDQVGYTKYHFFQLFVFIFVYFSDGTQIFVAPLILKSLQNEWNISTIEKSFFASSAFIGLVIGSFLAGQLLDKYGRKKFLLIGGSLVLVFGFVSSYSRNCNELIIMRILTGIGVGTQIPAATNLAAESIPTYSRSIYLANMWIAFPIGELYSCAIALYIMPNFEAEQWRLLLVLCLVPVLIGTLGSFFLKESVRYFLANSQGDQAKSVMIKLIPWELSENKSEELDRIIEQSLNNPLNKYQSSIYQLLSKRFANLTVKIWVIWFFQAGALYIPVYMLPQILVYLGEQSKSKSNNTIFKDIMISAILVIPKTAVGGFIAEIKYLGRVRSILICFITLIFLGILLVYDLTHSGIYCGLIKLSAGTIGVILKIYNCEIYPTKLRGIGYGSGHGFSRVGGMLVPFICEIIIAIFGIFGPIYYISFTSLIAAYCVYSLPYDTYGTNLDTLFQEDLIELKGIGQ